MGGSAKRPGRGSSAPGGFRRAKLLARIDHWRAGNRDSASHYSHAARTDSYATRTDSYATHGHGNTTNQPSAGIGRTDRSATERNDSGRDARLQLATNADSGHHTTVNCHA